MLPVCVAHIAVTYDVSASLIEAVAMIESRGVNPGKVGPNKNGTYDLGIMQINTYWLNRNNLAAVLRYGIDEQQLLNNDCTNVAVGAWILKQNLLANDDNVRAALSAYNTGKPDSKTGLAYADRVLHVWRSSYETASD